MIIPVWQPIGQSSNLIAQKMAENLGVKTSHTGTLDPMAEGVLIVLSGDDRLKKYEYAHWLKTYEFELCFGIATDSHDGMGLIYKEDDVTNISQSILTNTLTTFNGEYEQRVPLYSAVRFKGKKLLEHARFSDHLPLELPKKKGTLSDITLLSLSKFGVNTIGATLIEKIHQVLGDFRQSEIIKQWATYMQMFPDKKLYVARIKVTTTKGLYIRSLATDICNAMGTVGFAYSIVRVKNGHYTKEMC